MWQVRKLRNGKWHVVSERPTLKEIRVEASRVARKLKSVDIFDPKDLLFEHIQCS